MLTRPHAFATYIKYALGAAEILLAVRFVLKFLGAGEAIIVQCIYAVTDVIIWPFQGIFPNPHVSSGGMLDLEALTALVGYPIIASLLVELVHIITRHKHVSN